MCAEHLRAAERERDQHNYICPMCSFPVDESMECLPDEDGRMWHLVCLTSGGKEFS